MLLVRLFGGFPWLPMAGEGLWTLYVITDEDE